MKERLHRATVAPDSLSRNAFTARDPARRSHDIRLFFRPSPRGSSLPDFHPSSRVIVTFGENVLGVG